MTHDGLLAALGKRKDFTRADAHELWEANCDTSELGFTSLWTKWQLHKCIVKTTRIGNTHAYRWRRSKQKSRLEQFRHDAEIKDTHRHFPKARWSGGKATCPLFWMDGGVTSNGGSLTG